MYVPDYLRNNENESVAQFRPRTTFVTSPSKVLDAPPWKCTLRDINLPLYLKVEPSFHNHALSSDLSMQMEQILHALCYAVIGS